MMVVGLVGAGFFGKGFLVVLLVVRLVVCLVVVVLDVTGLLVGGSTCLCFGVIFGLCGLLVGFVLTKLKN